MYVNNDNVAYFDRFLVENIGFIDFMLIGKVLLDYRNLFSPDDYQKKNKIILKYFQ